MITDYISRERVEGKTSDISVYYRDLNNGPWFGINEKAYFAPASLNKVPLLIVTLKAAEKEPSILEQKIRVIDIEIYKEQNVQPEKKLKIGNEYSIYQLLEQMIVYSDNVAFDLVMNHIPYDTLEIIFKDLGIDVSQIYNQETTLTVKDYSSFFRILYNASYLSREMSETALKIMAKSTFQKGLVAGVPQSVKVSHKFGERAYKNSPERQFHDCGIIYHTDKPYLLCIMTKGNDFVNSYSVIKDISSMVYNFTSQ